MRNFNYNSTFILLFMLLALASCKKNEITESTIADGETAYRSGEPSQQNDPITLSTVTMDFCGDIVMMDLIKNQGSNNQVDVGDVSVYNDGANLYITVNPTAPGFINAINLYVGDCNAAPTTGRGSNLNAAPQNFPIQIGPGLGASTYTVTVPLSGLAPCYCIAMQVIGGGGIGTSWAKAANAVPFNSSNNSNGYKNEYCTQECENEVVCDWQEETAFGGSTAGAGNAWWYAIDASTSGSYPIYAGQNPVPGASVDYDAITDVITVNLGPNMQLQNVNEPVKAQGYNTLPNSRPAAGLFTLYKGTDLAIQGDNSNYYVVHLDVEVCNGN